MFTNLGQFIINRPRHAESADTRQGIHRQDSEKDQRKNKPGEQAQEEIFDQEDSATVSVEALYAFLESFLQSQGSQNSEHSELTADVTPDMRQEEKRPVTQASRAASAYQSTARASDKSQMRANPETSQQILKAEDIRTIHCLLETLKLLSERKIEYLRIERSDSFLGSLVQGAEKALNP